MATISELSASRLLNNIIKFVCVVVVIITAFIGIVLFKADFSELIIFMCFIAFYVLIPGLLLLQCTGITSQFSSVKLARGFFAGFACIVGIYFLSDVMGSNILLISIGPILSIIYIAKNRNKLSQPVDKLHSVASQIPTSLFVFFALVFVYSMCTTQYTYIPPSAADFSSIKLDFGFHAGIINSLARDFPPRNPWVSGRIISYHLFTELLYSIPVRLFGLESEEVLLCFTPYIISPLLTCSLYGFFREFMGNQKRCGLYCLSLVASNMFIMKSRYSSWFLYHLFSNINNAGTAASAVLVILTLFKYLDDAKRDRRTSVLFFVLLSAIIMLATGIKAPAVIVIVGGMIGTTLLSLILRRARLVWVCITLISSASFGFIYFYILGSAVSGQTNSSGGALLNPWEVTDIFFLKSNIMELMPRTLALPLVLIVFMVFTLTAFAVPFTVGYLRELYLVLSGKKDFVFSRVLIYASCMVGFIALMFFNFDGHSQVYFGFVALNLVPVISFWYLEEIQDSAALAPKLIRGAFALGLCITSFTVVMQFCNYAADSHDFYEDRNNSSSKYREVSAHEYDALMWLNENTDEEDIIASDRYYSVSLEKYDYRNRSHNNHFAYAIYSQREQYLEGSGFSLSAADNELRKEMIDNLNKMMDPGNDERDELARSLDVDYIMISKRFNDVGDLSSDDYTLVFTNEDVDIYKVEDAA